MANGRISLDGLAAVLATLAGDGVAEAEFSETGTLRRVRFFPAQGAALAEPLAPVVNGEDEELNASGFRVVRIRDFPPRGESLVARPAVAPPLCTEVRVPYTGGIAKAVNAELARLAAEGFEPYAVTAPAWRESALEAVVLVLSRRPAK